MNLLDAVKLANDVADRLANVELKQALATVKLEAVDLAEQIVRLRTENLELREAARLRDVMAFHDNVYWTKPDSGADEGPYCPTCWDGDRKQVRLIVEDRYHWRCTVCGKTRWQPGGRDRWHADGRAGESGSRLPDSLR